MKNTDQQFQETIQNAINASQSNDAQIAIQLFTEASTLNPSSAIPHFLVAAEFMELGQTEQAEAAYARAVLLNSQLHIARFQLGLLFLTTSREEMALVTWEPLLSLEPTNPLRLFAEGFAAMLSNTPEVAVNCFEQGIIQNQENPPLNADMQRILSQLKTQIETKVNESTPEAMSQITAIDASKESTSEEETNHFLLSNYQQHGTLH